jgi:hypothetical protein
MWQCKYVYRRAFLTTAADVVSGQFHDPAALTQLTVLVKLVSFIEAFNF